jgi:anthranilate synthase component 2
MNIVIIDNYDSFTYNLVHAVQQITGLPLTVLRNDAFALSDLEQFDKMILSPGPGVPTEAGLLMDVLAAYATNKPILGVCLGHQAIGQHFGRTLKNLTNVYHGVATTCNVEGTYTNETWVPLSPLFKDLPDTIEIGRYHSWVVSNDKLPSELVVTATDANGYIMAMQHQSLPVYGVQFHPESVLTPSGIQIIKNWLVATSV